MAEWRPIKNFRGETSKFNDRKQVDLWMHIVASPMSMGFGDAFRVPNCWKVDGKWFHLHEGQEKELASHYITHWMPVPKPPTKREMREATYS